MLRKGDGYEPISWDEAINLIAEKIAAAPERFGFYGSGQWKIGEGCAANKFMKAGLGSNQIDGNPRLCMSSAVTGFLSCYGVDEPAGCYDDLDAYWEEEVLVSGPYEDFVLALPAAERSAIRERLGAMLRPYEAAGGYRVPGVTLVASGRRPHSET